MWSLVTFHLGVQNSNRGDACLRVDSLVECVTSCFIAAEESSGILWGRGGGTERDSFLGVEVLGSGFQEAARLVLFAPEFYFNQVVELTLHWPLASGLTSVSKF